MTDADTKDVLISKLVRKSGYTMYDNLVNSVTLAAVLKYTTTTKYGRTGKRSAIHSEACFP